MSSSNYNARRAPNVSQYLANLNTIPSAQELAAQQSQLEFNETDLEFLTNAEFFDFDQFHPVNDQRFPPGARPPASAAAAAAAAAEGFEGAKGVGMTGAQYSQFGEFQTYPATVASTPTSLHGGYNTHSPTGLTPPHVGDKRKAGAHGVATAADLEEQSRLAAEEDKRRRNTAASARFRVKKKQREQALEKQAKEMADKVSLLEGKVQQLEMENKWHMGLITDKNDGKVPEMVRAKAGDDKAVDERSTDAVKRGIGTLGDEEAEGRKA